MMRVEVFCLATTRLAKLTYSQKSCNVVVLVN